MKKEYVGYMGQGTLGYAVERWRLMGFSDEDYQKASTVCSQAQLGKQAGNSIIVDILEEIFKEIIHT